jgi:hypothetical protein
MKRVSAFIKTTAVGGFFVILPILLLYLEILKTGRPENISAPAAKEIRDSSDGLSLKKRWARRACLFFRSRLLLMPLLKSVHIFYPVVEGDRRIRCTHTKEALIVESAKSLPKKVLKINLINFKRLILYPVF